MDARKARMLSLPPSSEADPLRIQKPDDGVPNEPSPPGSLNRQSEPSQAGPQPADGGGPARGRRPLFGN